MYAAPYASPYVRPSPRMRCELGISRHMGRGLAKSVGRFRATKHAYLLIQMRCFMTRSVSFGAVLLVRRMSLVIRSVLLGRVLGVSFSAGLLVME